MQKTRVGTPGTKRGIMSIFIKKLKHIPRNILVARTDKIGDFVLTLPVFEVIKKELGMNCSVLCREMVKPLLKHNPYVDNIITVNQDNDELVDQIQSHDFDCLLVLVNDPIIRDLLPRLRKIPVRIGPLSRLSVLFQYTHPVVQKRSRSILNEAEYNLELLKIFGLKKIIPVRPSLSFSELEISDFRPKLLKLLKTEDLPERFIVFHQGMSGSALNWSKSNYFKLLKMALKQNLVVMLTGSTEEEIRQNRLFFDELSSDFPFQLFDLTNCFSLRELAILIALSTLFIGPSTGITHIANATGTDIISFYPPIQVQSAKRWEPYMAKSFIFTPDVPCSQKYKCLGEKCSHYYCMDSITAEEVFKQLKKMVPPLSESSV
ncbi:MAG: glycosyltransferase family 9 protein [Proteobacteria bacterium]|nr:glycosyltransferase family 9 protein [Pseudomonadota bacterium]